MPNVVSEDDSARFLEELATVPPPGSAAAALHNALLASWHLDLKRIRQPSPRHASPMPERLQRLVVCVLLRHHELVPDAVAAGSMLLSGGDIFQLPQELRMQLSTLWAASHRLRRWVSKQVEHAVSEESEGAEPNGLHRDGGTAVDAAKEEERVCTPIERRALFLLRSVRLALPRHLSEPSTASSVVAAHLPRRSLSGRSPVAVTRSNSLAQLAQHSRPWSYNRARDRLRVSSQDELTGDKAAALELAEGLEKHWNRLRRQALRATGIADWHVGRAAQKFGTLTALVRHGNRHGVRAHVHVQQALVRLLW